MLKKIIFFLVLILLFLITYVFAVDRCVQYKQEARKQMMYYWGSDFPYWYALGIAKTESFCRADIKSFDGGEGLFQFTRSTGINSEIEKELIPNFNPNNAKQSIQAFAYYTTKIKKRMHIERMSFRKKGQFIYPKKYIDKCGFKLGDMFQIYNGGVWLIREFEEGKSLFCERQEIKMFCLRGGTTYKGKYISFCDVNYSYPDRVYNNSLPYKEWNDKKWKY